MRHESRADTVSLRLVSRIVLLAALVPLSGGFPPSALAAGVTTSFEFTDTDGTFTLGTAPDAATFQNGRAQTLGAPGLYKSGLNAWMIVAGQSGTILFESPVASVTLWFRDETAAVASVLTALDKNDNVIATFNGTTVFQKVTLVASEADRIGRITFANNGAAGHAVIDDFVSCMTIETGPLDDPTPVAIPRSGVAVQLVPVATGLTAPNWGTAAPGQPGRLFVTDQNGILWAIDLASGIKSVFLDASGRLVGLGVFGPDSFDERGLLGVAFHPDYATNGFLYTYTSEPVGATADFSTMPPATTANHQSVIAEWHVPDPTNPASVVDPASARVLMRVDEPQFNHNGGALNFGPDGMLYVSLGDGGGADDQDAEPFIGGPTVGHGPDGNGQNPSNVLGTILRIDPRGSSSANGQYGIPAGNPFVGAAGVAEEIYAFGFRNPFRFSFDSLTGDMYIGDVGQNDIEEIDIGMAGGNFGWRLMEGSFFFDPNGTDAGFVTNVDPDGTDDLLRPIAEYDHDEGTAVIGGFLYRGTAVAGLTGKYVFGDFARTFSNDGRLFHLDDGAQVVELRLVGRTALDLSLLGFAQDAAGELYVLGNETGTPFGQTGVVMRIDAAPGLCGIAPEPAEGCRQPGAGKASLQVVDETPGTAGEKDRMKWKWSNGAATDLADFGEPLAGAPVYRVCLYDASGKLAEIELPPGGTCDGKPCWKTIGSPSAPKGFKYKNKAGDPEGIVNARLKAGPDGKAQVQIVARGLRLDVPAPPFATPVTAQLLVEGAGTLECWQTTFSTAKKNVDGTLKAKGP